MDDDNPVMVNEASTTPQLLASLWDMIVNASDLEPGVSDLVSSDMYIYAFTKDDKEVALFKQIIFVLFFSSDRKNE